MSTWSLMEWGTSLWPSFVWRGLVLAAAALILIPLARLSHPAARHRAWLGVVLGMLALPVLHLALPTWSVHLPWPASVRAGSAPTLPLPADLLSLESIATSLSADPDPKASLSASSAPEEFTGVSWGQLLLTLYLLGAGALLARLALGWLLTRRMVAQAQPTVTADSPDELRLRVHPRVLVPVCTGWWRPTILLPLAWRDWSKRKRRSVIAHERMHIERRDYLVQILAALNRALHWPNPLAWWLPRQLSLLAERSCDEAMAASGMGRRDYARTLLEIAAAMQGEGKRIAPQGNAMAEPQNLQSRVLALASPSGSPKPAGIWSRLFPLAGILFLSLAAASLGFATVSSDSPVQTLQAPGLTVPSAAPRAERTHSVKPAGKAALPNPRENPGLTQSLQTQSLQTQSLQTQSLQPLTQLPPMPLESSPPAGSLQPDHEPSDPAQATIALPPLPPSEATMPLTPGPTSQNEAITTTRRPTAPIAPPPASLAPATIVPEAEIRLADRIPTPVSQSPAKLAGSTDGDQGDTLHPATGVRNILLFFDNANRVYVRKPRLSRRGADLAKRLLSRELRPEDRVAVLSHRSGLRVHQDLTQDSKAIARALAEVRRWRAYSQRSAAEGTPALLPALESSSALGRQGRDVVRALELLSLAAAKIEGQTILLVFTTGFDRSPADLESLTQIAKDNGLVVHTIDLLPPGTYEKVHRLGGARLLAEESGGSYTLAKRWSALDLPPTQQEARHSPQPTTNNRN